MIQRWILTGSLTLLLIACDSKEEAKPAEPTATTTTTATATATAKPAPTAQSSTSAVPVLTGEAEGLKDKCEKKDGNACSELGLLFEDGKVGGAKNIEQALVYYRQGCDLDGALGCNNYAWVKCHDQKSCDPRTLADAEKAVKLDAKDGDYLDTLAYVECQLGKQEDARKHWKKACLYGQEDACKQKCTK